MLGWLGEKILSISCYVPMEKFQILLFLFLGLLVLGFQLSRRMNARVEAAAPASSPPRRPVQAFLAKETALPSSPDLTDFINKTKRGLAWLLQKTDGLLRDILQLLPDERTGKRLNYFVMLFAAWLVMMSACDWLPNGKAAALMDALRDSVELVPEARWKLFGSFCAFVLCLSLLLLPFFLLEKNREFYFDVTALLALLSLGVQKVVFCWSANNGQCCFGIPCSWGVFNVILQATTFPVQLLECALWILGAVLCIFYMLYAKSYAPGRGCSFCAFAYMGTRFFTEFLRYHGEGFRAAEANGLFGLSMVQIVCVVGVALGVAWLFALPLEKKLADRFWLFTVGRLRREEDSN